MPPPVEAGDAPIHIKTINRSAVGTDNAAVSVLLKPAVRVVTEPKNAAVHLPKGDEYQVNTPSFSKIKKPIVPIISRIAVVIITICEFTLITNEE